MWPKKKRRRKVIPMMPGDSKVIPMTIDEYEDDDSDN